MLSPQLSSVLAVVSEIHNNYYYLLYIHNQMTKKALNLNLFSLTDWYIKQHEVNQMLCIAFLMCGENYISNQEPCIRCFMLELYQGDFHLCLPGSTSLFKLFAKFYNFPLQTVFKVEFL